MLQFHKMYMSRALAFSLRDGRGGFRHMMLDERRRCRAGASSYRDDDCIGCRHAGYRHVKVITEPLLA